MSIRLYWILAACWILLLAFVFGLVLFPQAVPFVGGLVRDIRYAFPFLFFTTVAYGLVCLYKAGVYRAARKAGTKPPA